VKFFDCFFYKKVMPYGERKTGHGRKSVTFVFLLSGCFVYQKITVGEISDGDKTFIMTSPVGRYFLERK